MAFQPLLSHTTFDPALDREILGKTISGTLTEDEKAWIATYNAMGEIITNLGIAISEEFGIDAIILDDNKESNDVP